MFLNIDAGELEDEPEELYSLAHVVNVACGGHAGDDASMRRVIAFCNQSSVLAARSMTLAGKCGGAARSQLGTRVGAHPSFPDRAGFGRVAMTMPDDELLASVAEQCHALASCARAEGDAPLAFVKLHGALYHAANGDASVARAALRGAIEALGWEITVIGPPVGETIACARDLGLAYAREGFADRGVRADGSLVPRGEPGAMIDEPERAVRRAKEIALAKNADTICVHGDGKNALAVARAVRAMLDAL